MSSANNSIIQEGSVLVYDGSFPGFLCCVYPICKLRLTHARIQKSDQVQGSLFGTETPVDTDETRAKKVWEGLDQRLGKPACDQIYRAFLSEQPGVEELLVRYIKHGLKSRIPIHNDYAQPDVLQVSKLVKKVGREKHRMEAFVRFRLTRDELYFAQVAPDFDVLPLINRHFTDRYADQRWLIYDEKRAYGIYYNLEHTEAVSLALPKGLKAHDTPDELFQPEEQDYQQLWKDYFRSTNIKSRKNDKLHLQHVPKRYWRYLTEKLPS
ncbi:MAG: TIGR03915 family putative DNA repair protein [Roseivirga sp.]